MTYKITCTTNGYQASRNIMFNGVYCGGSSATAIIKNGLSLEEAKNQLLYFYQDDYSNERSGNYPNWSVILRHDNRAWNDDGLFGYEHDGYYYQIVKETED